MTTASTTKQLHHMRQENCRFALTVVSAMSAAARRVFFPIIMALAAAQSLVTIALLMLLLLLLRSRRSSSSRTDACVAVCLYMCLRSFARCQRSSADVWRMRSGGELTVQFRQFLVPQPPPHIHPPSQPNPTDPTDTSAAHRRQNRRRHLARGF